MKSAAAILLLPIGWRQKSALAQGAPPRPVARRVRPGDPAWPSAESWDRLNREVGGRLIKVQSPLAALQHAPTSALSSEVFQALKNPYYISDQPGLTQTSGWVGAWTSAPSVFAVAATTTEDVVAAVNFARERNLRLVIKGGGHSFQGRSNSVDSLLIWTRAMNRIVLHDAFVAQGCAEKQTPQPAVTIGAGALWMDAYDAVTTKAGRYVQGGGCTTVGVAGLIQSGGFSTFSKNYGLAAAGLLEAEIVTADGMVRIANACTNPDLFWGIKGGGGGSLGVVTRVTLRTRELPPYFGSVWGTIKAKSDAAYRRLIARFFGFYHDHLFNRHWGERIVFSPGHRISVSLVFQGLNRQQAERIWKPFVDWVSASPQDFTFEVPVGFAEIPARRWWDAAFWRKFSPGSVVVDDRPDAPKGNFFWRGDGGQVGWVLHGFRSAWLPAALLKKGRRSDLVDALVAGSRWEVALQFDKGLAGTPAEVLAEAKDTAMNPAVLDAFALAIIAGEGPPGLPGIPGHEPDVKAARRRARAINAAMDELLKVVRNPGSYVGESDFFERSWQQSFWGSNYPRLAAVKKRYDPDGLFFVHHGVGSEEWSADGFRRS